MSPHIHRVAQADIVRVDGLTGSAWFSPGGDYRYGLMRRWSLADGPLAFFIMLNSSTADAFLDDPTVRRCIGFAKLWGYPGLVIANLFAVRGAEPKDALLHPDPVGSQNDFMIHTLLSVHGTLQVVCGWGAHGGFMNRGQDVLDIIRGRGFTPYCLGLTGSQQPRHPLYIRGDAPLEIYHGQP